jgi:TM2 domain-containing membrane protein YozV
MARRPSQVGLLSALMTDTPPPPPPPSPDVPGVGSPPTVESKRLVCGILGILLGAFGIHKFVLGYTKEGVIMLVLTITCIGYPFMAVIGLIEGIMYLMKSDQEFIDTYQVGHKGWF